jgi:Cu-processing system permease protein
MTIPFVLAGTVLREMVRRKDLFALLAVTLLLMGLGASLNVFNLSNVSAYLIELGLTLVLLFAVGITITAAARQLPAEIEAKTIYPLLARPITRGQLLVGKYLGVLAAAELSLALFAAAMTAVLWAKGAHFSPAYWQALYLYGALLAIVAALAIFFSTVTSSPAVTVAVTLILTVALLSFPGQPVEAALAGNGVSRTLGAVLLTTLPRLDLFDLKQRATFDWGAIPWTIVIALTAYAAVYASLLLGGGWLVLRRRAL